VDFMVYQGQSLSNILHRFDESDFAISQFEGLRVDGSEVIDEDNNNLNHIGPSSSNYSITTHDQDHHVITSTKKKNKSNRFLPGIVLSLGSRRKGAPQRAPLL
ncbi:zinc-binding protein, partial [Trifolium medium]|nr:zinc-binding protein [Trifolium medium]